MRMLAAIAIVKGLAALALIGAGTADAAEIKMLVSNAMKTTLEELAPQFETASEHKLAITFGAASELKTAIEKGAAFDVAILTPAVIEALVTEGKLSAAAGAAIARAGFGIAARKGARHRHDRGVQACAAGRQIDRLRGGGRGLALFQELARAAGHRRPDQAQAQAAADQQSGGQSGRQWRG
jgi:ABC-type molybdate transport system substrate-binding protein